MDEIPIEVREKVRTFLSKLNDSNISIIKAILFGSYSTNQFNEFSDIDIALVSSDFSGNPYFDNQKIRKAKLSSSYDIETHTFSEAEFNSENPFVKEILKHGIVVQ